jgi:hypothetical protein
MISVGSSITLSTTALSDTPFCKRQNNWRAAILPTSKVGARIVVKGGFKYAESRESS